jgi:hypothetical protein
MTYPGYLLNPGDMFSVDPERVMFATGMKKSDKQISKPKKAAEGEEGEGEEAQEEATEESEVKESEAEVAEADSASKELDAAVTPEEAKRALRVVMNRAKRITTAAKGDLSGRRLKDLRKLSHDVRKTMAKFGSRDSKAAPTVETVEELAKVLTEITLKIPTESLPASDAPTAKAGAPSRESACSSFPPSLTV